MPLSLCGWDVGQANSLHPQVNDFQGEMEEVSGEDAFAVNNNN